MPFPQIMVVQFAVLYMQLAEQDKVPPL